MTRKVCILLPRVGVYPDLGIMLAESFSGLGWQPVVRHEADAELLDQDLLLLAGLCQRIDGLPEVLRRRRNRKPATILWQLEPLPPAELSPAGERLGLRAAAFDWDRLPRAVRTKVNSVIPFGSSGWSGAGWSCRIRGGWSTSPTMRGGCNTTFRIMSER
jgi:hypothetical protein